MTQHLMHLCLLSDARGHGLLKNLLLVFIQVHHKILFENRLLINHSSGFFPVQLDGLYGKIDYYL